MGFVEATNLKSRYRLLYMKKKHPKSLIIGLFYLLKHSEPQGRVNYLHSIKQVEPPPWCRVNKTDQFPLVFLYLEYII